MRRSNCTNSNGLTVVVVLPIARACGSTIPTPSSGQETQSSHALVSEISHLHEAGRPVLVGTTSVAESEHLAALPGRVGDGVRILNAGTMPTKPPSSPKPAPPAW